MINQVLQQRIIETADEYHYIAEHQWELAIELQPETEEAVFEFRRLVRAALHFYARAYLALAMVETDAEQDLEEVLDIVLEQHEDLQRFFQQNDVTAVIAEDAHTNLSHVFSVVEAVRGQLLELSNQLAATLGMRFSSDV